MLLYQVERRENNMKLLIVEDEATIQDALCKGFRKLGYVVESAFDGEEAVNMFYSRGSFVNERTFSVYGFTLSERLCHS